VQVLTKMVSGAMVVFLVALGSVPAVRAADDQPYIVDGGGWGHGVGMSQYGAYGQALDNKTYDQILKHYYFDPAPGTNVALANLGGDLPTPGPLWVNLLQEVDGIELINRTIGAGPGADVVISQDGATVALAAGELATVTMSNGTCTITTPAGTLQDGSCTIDLQWDGEAESPTTRVEIPRFRSWGAETWTSCRLNNWTSGTSPNCSYARGVLHVRPDMALSPSSGRYEPDNGLHLVVEVDVEDYVLGISEMPYYWGEKPGGIEALKAQAIAARSYALNRKVRRSAPEYRPWCWCSLFDTPVDQYYVGWGHATSVWITAVSDTAGKVLTHPSEFNLSGEPVPIQTYYSSSTGGMTENVEDVWPPLNPTTKPIPYLRSRDDHWAVGPLVKNPYATWTAETTTGALRSALGWDELSGAEVVAGPPGTVIHFTGTDNGSAVTADKTGAWLRSQLGLRSPYVVSIKTAVVFPDAYGSGPYEAILAILEANITQGCGNGLYCPMQPVTRGQMASFLARALDLPAPVDDYFSDDNGNTHESNINRLVEAGITVGFSDGTFRPYEVVSRAQMGSFLARAMGLEPLSGSRFTDVSGPHAGNINAIAEAGVTLGCTKDGTRFCPNDPVRRDQMASFLARAFLWIG